MSSKPVIVGMVLVPVAFGAVVLFAAGCSCGGDDDDAVSDDDVAGDDTADDGGPPGNGGDDDAVDDDSTGDDQRDDDAGGDLPPDDDPASCPDGTLEHGACRAVAPASPELRSWTCAEGYSPAPGFTGAAGTMAAVEGVAAFEVCTPPQPPEDCPAGTMAVLGQAACVTVGDPCPAGEWPETLPAASHYVYVRSGATGGDGTIDQPLGDLQDAFFATGDGAAIVLSKGQYTGGAVLTRKVIVIGACAAETIIAPDGPSEDDGTIEITDNGDVTIRNVTVTGARSGIWVWGTDLPAAIEGVIVDGAQGVGITFSTDSAGGAVRDTLITRMQPNPSDNDLGWGLLINPGTMVTVERVELRGNRDEAVHITGETGSVRTEAVLNDIVVRDTLPRASDERYGWGLSVTGDAHASVARAWFHGNSRRSVLAAGVEGIAAPGIDVTDLYIHGPADLAHDMGHGLEVIDGASATVERALITYARGTAIGLSRAAGFDAPALALTDVVIRDTQPEPATADSAAAPAVAVTAGAGTKLSAARVAIERAHGVALAAGGAGESTALTLSDVVVRAAVAEGSLDGALPPAMVTTTGSTAGTIERMLIDGAAGAAVVLTASDGDTAPNLRIDDLTVRAGDIDLSAAGRGISAEGAVRLALTRAVLSGNADYGCAVIGPESAAGGGIAGGDRRAGGDVADGTGSRVATLDLSDVVISGVRARAVQSGSGLAVTGRVALSALRTFAMNNALAGVHLDGPLAVVSRFHGAVSGNAIGVALTQRLDAGRLLPAELRAAGNLQADVSTGDLPAPVPLGE